MTIWEATVDELLGLGDDRRRPEEKIQFRESLGTEDDNSSPECPF